MNAMRTIEWHEGTVMTIDQCKLPQERSIIKMTTPLEVANAISSMKIRGAPLLGAAAAYGLALTAYHSRAKTKNDLVADLEKSAELIRKTRPTAVNLSWALDRIMKTAKDFSGNAKSLAILIVEEAQKIADEDTEANIRIGKFGAKLIIDGDTILTHCNAGALATVDYGTALGVIRAAWDEGKHIKVIATETRPKLQGARLTTYELKREGIPVTLVTDSMVGFIMHRKMIDKVIVGADRIVKDGVVNKVGTFTIAIVAKEHSVPFYVAAPSSTFDLDRKAKDVIIEERSPDEVTHIGTQRIAPKGVKALNPAFDITPLKYVTAIISETGIFYKSDFSKMKTKIDKLHRS
jgi:methylthioribose-1-phosphate isomerase